MRPSNVQICSLHSLQDAVAVIWHGAHKSQSTVVSLVSKTSILDACVAEQNPEIHDLCYRFWKKILKSGLYFLSNSIGNLGAISANLPSKISPRLLNIFNSGFFYKQTMTLLYKIRTFPALSEGFWKWRHYTYHNDFCY